MKIKIFTIFMALFVMLTVPVFASTPTLQIEAAKTDETIDVVVSITNNPGIAIFSLVLNFDREAFTPIGIKKGGALKAGAIISNLQDPSIGDLSNVSVVWYSASNITDNGDLFTVRLQAKEGVSGTFPLTLTYHEGDIKNQNGENINFEMINSTIAIGQSGDNMQPTPPSQGSSSGSMTPQPTPTPEIPIIDADHIPSAVDKFIDVSESDWFYTDVKYVVANSLFKGMTKDIFSPNEPMTRAMFVTVLWRMNGEPIVDNQPSSGTYFVDVYEGQWYSLGVAWAAENGIVTGVGEFLFAPDIEITREQMATILYRYEQFSGEIPPDILMDSAFSDWNSISDYAKNAVNVLVIQGIINGKPDNIFDPQGTAIRAEVAALLHRFRINVT